MANDYAKQLSKQIMLQLENEFKEKHLSGNLLKTIRVDEFDDYVEIHIPAPTYDFAQYFLKGLVVAPQKAGLPTSYAKTLNYSGSQFTLYWEDDKGNVHKKKEAPRNHIGYLERAIKNGISNWAFSENLEIKFEQGQ